MKKTKFICCTALAAVMALSMTGCEFIDKLTGRDAVVEDSEETVRDIKVADQSVHAPVFVNPFKNLLPTIVGTDITLDGTATSDDGGTVTYQWYENTIDSNSGGTRIDGATEATYKPDTSVPEIKFYYVVATNEIGDKYNVATGSVYRVETLKAGQWSQDEFGGIRYLSDDGSYIADREVTIDGNDYYFESNGYRYSGWRYTDAYYFYQEDGIKLKNGERDGYVFDADGKLISGQDPLGLFQNAAQPAEGGV
jgi:hypothetical protein